KPRVTVLVIGCRADWIGPVGQAEVVGVPDFAALTVGRRADRDDAVVVAFGLAHELVCQTHPGLPAIVGMLAGYRKVAHTRRVRYAGVELLAALGGQVVKGLVRETDQLQDRLEHPFEPANTPVREGAAPMGRAER